MRRHTLANEGLTSVLTSITALLEDRLTGSTTGTLALTELSVEIDFSA
jgi:hypothetical protein